jgi:hypothetical protein
VKASATAMKSKRKRPGITVANAIATTVWLTVWTVFCIFPAAWNIYTEDSVYRRYKVWRLSSAMIGNVTLPYYDVYHKARFPLHNAVIRDNTAKLVRIAQDKHNPDQLDNFAMTALAYAARSGLKDAAKHLLDNGANPDIKTFQNMTPLLLALSNNRKELAMLLLDSGADTGITDMHGASPAHLAAENDFDNVLAKIAELGGSLDSKDAKGLVPLDYAIRKAKMKSVVQLAASGAECRFSQTPGNDSISIFLQKWQESGNKKFSLAIAAEYESRNNRSNYDSNIPAELPVNVEPHTFRDRGR